MEVRTKKRGRVKRPCFPGLLDQWVDHQDEGDRPTPSVPPSRKAPTMTLLSISVRTNRTEWRVQRTRPVIRPSRGPGPRCAPRILLLCEPSTEIVSVDSHYGLKLPSRFAAGGNARCSSARHPTRAPISCATQTDAGTRGKSWSATGVCDACGTRIAVRTTFPDYAEQAATRTFRSRPALWGVLNVRRSAL